MISKTKEPSLLTTVSLKCIEATCKGKSKRIATATACGYIWKECGVKIELYLYLELNVEKLY